MIGITECGDAGLDFSWVEQMPAMDFAVLITKNVNDKFIKEVVKVKEKSCASPKFKEIREMTISTPSWITVDADKLEGKILAMPQRQDIDTPIAEHLIVELYSK